MCNIRKECDSVKILQMADAVRYRTMTTEELRETFLLSDLFQPGKVSLTYVDLDRAVIGSAVPTGEPLPLPTEDALRATFFTERRELGILNIGAAGTVTVNGVAHELKNLDALYVGRGNEKIVFSSADPKLPAEFYLLSYPAHAVHPTKLVHSVDSSVKALEGAKQNVELNGMNDGRHEVFAMDAKQYLEEMEEQYDLIVLDPPAYAKHMDARHKAIKGYVKLNRKAIEKIAPGGILFTFSCSQVVDRQQFYSAVTAAAIEAGREIKILHQLSQSADHPINIFHPEGQYPWINPAELKAILGDKLTIEEPLDVMGAAVRNGK